MMIYTAVATTAKQKWSTIFEDSDYSPGSTLDPTWWGWYSWPNWWSCFNGVGKITWHETVKPKETLDLSSAWNYFWRRQTQ